MTKKILGFLVVASVSGALLNFASAKTVHFTQVGSGVAGSLAFRTVFQVTNENPADAQGSIVLHRADGLAMETAMDVSWVERAGEARTEGNRLDFTIPPRSSLRVVLPPGPQVSVGWATLETDLDVSASAVTQFANNAPGEFEANLINEVESVGTPGMTSFSFPLTYVAAGRGVETAFAVSNTSPVAATVTLLRRPDDETSMVLPPGGVFSAYMSQIWPEAATGPRYEGLAEVSSSAPLGSLVFRTLGGLPLSGVAPGPTGKAPEGVPAKMAEEFTLALNQTAVIETENLAVTFTGVSEDSRCPSDVVCVWEGQARVSVRVDRAGAQLGEIELILRAGNLEMARETVGGYVVQAVRLEPYPVSTAPIKAEQYRLTLVVRPE